MGRFSHAITLTVSVKENNYRAIEFVLNEPRDGGSTERCVVVGCESEFGPRRDNQKNKCAIETIRPLSTGKQWEGVMVMGRDRTPFRSAGVEHLFS
jgi:hypothetical protein